jgi:hypothetical protein
MFKKFFKYKTFLILFLIALTVASAFLMRSDPVMKFTEVSAEYRTNIPEEILVKYYDSIGPSKILDVLESENFCHDKSHNVGKLIFRNEQNMRDSLDICEQRCSSGCFHGIIMEIFADLGEEADHTHDPDQTVHDPHIILTKDNEEDVKNRILSICTNDDVQNYFGEGDCVHGVGHAVMSLAAYDTDTALDLCSIFERTGLEYYCSTGVFMERNLTFEKTDAKKGIFYPCTEFTDFPAACYRYEIQDLAPKADPVEIAAACTELPSLREQRGCYHGIGFGFFKKIIEDPEQISVMCSSTDSISERLCIEGAIGKINVSSSDKARTTCSYVKEEFSDICIKAIHTGNFGMSRDFSFYDDE